MKIVFEDIFLDIASAGLRCARDYVVCRDIIEKIESRAERNKLADRYIRSVQELGKYVGYMIVLSKVGYAEAIDVDETVGYEILLNDFKKGKIALLKGKTGNLQFLMDKKFFEKVLNHNDLHYTKEYLEDIKRWSPEIK